MNFLQICQRLRREARISGSGPASVLNQAGEMQLIVDWVQSAYEDIQNMNHNWLFLQNQFTFNTIAATSTYMPAAAGLSELQAWKVDGYNAISLYRTSTGVSGQQDINWIPWDEMRGDRFFGSTSLQTGQPIEYAVKPDKSIVFWPIPDDVYTISGEYFKKAQPLVNNTD